MYDLSLSNTSDHLYYSNGFLSHNTTTYTIFALWYTMFFPDKKIMVLCNKASVMSEVIGRIQLAYQYLPKFLKSAVSVWNKTEIIFSNHSAIKGFPASSDSARGFSANCVNKDSIISIRSKYIKWITVNLKIKHLVTIAKIQNFTMNLMSTIRKFFSRIMYILDNNKFNYSHMIKGKNNKELYNWLMEKTNHITDPNINVSTRLYMLIHDIHDIPKCKTCGKEIGKKCY